MEQEDTKQPIRRRTGTRTQITDDIRERLHEEVKRTNVGPHALLKSLDDVPRGLNANMVRAWIDGATASAWPDHLAFVLQAYGKIKTGQAAYRKPLKSDSSRITLTDEMRQRLARIHAAAPSNYLDRLPIKFSPVQMANTLSGRNASMPRDVWTMLIALESPGC